MSRVLQRQALRYFSRVTGKPKLRFLLLSYQKKNWRAGPHQSFFWYDTNYRFIICSLHRLYFIVGVILKEGLAGHKDLKVGFPVTRLIILWLSYDEKGRSAFTSPAQPSLRKKKGAKMMPQRHSII